MFPVLLYHGTSTAYLRGPTGILKNGLDPRSSGSGYLCYTDDIEIARWHAEHMADWDADVVNRPCQPVVFAIPFEEFDRQGFCRDENFIRLGPSHGRAVNKGVEIRRRHLQRAWRWPELLKFAGSVGYKKLMPVTNSVLLRPKKPGIIQVGPGRQTKRTTKW